MNKYPPVLLVFFLVGGATSLVALPMDGPTVDARGDNVPLHDLRENISSREDNQDGTREVGTSEQEQFRATTLSVSEEKSAASSTTDTDDNPFTFPITNVNRDSMELSKNISGDQPLPVPSNNSNSAAPSHVTTSQLPAHFNGIELEDVTKMDARVIPLERRMTFSSDFSRSGTTSTWSHVKKTTEDATDQEEAISTKASPRSSLEELFSGFERASPENRPFFLQSLYHKYKIEQTSSEAQELRNYLFKRLAEEPLTSSWEQIAEKSLQNENLNENFRLRDLQPSSSKLLKKAGIFASLGLTSSSSPSEKKELLLACLKDSLKKSLAEYYSKSLDQMIEETGIDPTAEHSQLRASATNDLEAITRQLEATLEDPSIPSSHAVQEAHKNMIISLYRLREYATQSSSKSPQFCKTASGEWAVIQPAPHLENLVLAGGGMKGVGYIGFLKTAEQAGILKNLKHIAGSSAGAMTASLIASGMDVMEVEEASGEIDFSKVLVASSNDSVIKESSHHYQGGCYDLHSIGFSGNYMMKQLNQKIARSIKNYFELLGEGGLEKKMAATGLEPEEWRSLLSLRETIAPSLTTAFATPSETTHLVTFRELALLRKLDPRFKDFTVTAFNVDQQQTVYHNAGTAPDMPIAEAVAISAALPGAYKARVDQATGDTLVDGGVGSNIPSEVFSNEPNAKTLVLGFDNDGRFNDTVYRNATSAYVNPQSIEAKFSGNNNFPERTRRDREKLKAAGPNAFSVKHGKLGTISFGASEKRLTAAQRQAEIHAWEQLSLRQNQALHTVFPTLETAMEQMTDEELEDIAMSYATRPNEKETLSADERSNISHLAQAEMAKR